MKTVIEAARAFTGSEVLNDVHIVVEDGVIIEVVSGPAPAGDYTRRLVFGGSVVVLPGLINGHVHMAGNGGDDAFEFLSSEPPSVLQMRGTANLRTALDAGVTTIRDCGTRNDVAFALQAAVARGLILGPQVLTSGAVMTITGGHGFFFGVEVDTPAEIVKAVRQQQKLGAHLVKVMLTGGLMTRTRPARLQFDKKNLGLLCNEAHELGLPVAAHCLNTEGIRLAATVGVDTIEHGKFADAEGQPIFDPVVADLVATKRIPVSMGHMHGFRALTEGFRSRHPEIRSVVQVQRSHHIDNYRRYLELGVRLFLGDDAGWWLMGFDDYHANVKSLIDEIGMSALEAWRVATSGTAAAIGIGNVVGSIAKGYRADIIAVRADAFDSPASSGGVVFVMRGGGIYREPPQAS